MGFRVYGDTDIFSPPKNFNYEMRRQNEETFRHKFIAIFIALTFVPVFYMIYNAEANFKKAGVKEIAKNRRQRLDKEHGIDRT